MAFGDRRKKKYADFVQTAAGEYAYIGEHYAYDADNPLPYKRYRIAVGLACTGAASMMAAAGLYRAPGSTRSAFVILPYLFALCFTALMCYKGARLVRAGNPMRAFDYDAIMARLRQWACAATLFSVILLVCYFVHLVRCGREGCALPAVIGYPVMIALAAASDVWLWRICAHNIWYVVRRHYDEEADDE